MTKLWILAIAALAVGCSDSTEPAVDTSDEESSAVSTPMSPDFDSAVAAGEEAVEETVKEGEQSVEDHLKDAATESAEDAAHDAIDDAFGSKD